MIASFADKETEKVFAGEISRKFPRDIQKRALAKLMQLDAALELDEMRVPPGNRLELLKGDRAGQYSVRINRGWRICFAWEAGKAYEVEINHHYGD